MYLQRRSEAPQRALGWVQQRGARTRTGRLRTRSRGPRPPGRRSHTPSSLPGVRAAAEPSNRELIEAGLGGLYARLYRRGELDAWAARLGLGRNRAAWTDHEIQRALDGLYAGLERFPTREQFRDAGLESLHGVLQARGELDSWARCLGLARRRRWTDATIAAALNELCAGCQQFPTVREFRDAGLGGLYSILGRRGELDRWAQQLELPRRKHQRSENRASGRT